MKQHDDNNGGGNQNDRGHQHIDAGEDQDLHDRRQARRQDVPHEHVLYRECSIRGGSDAAGQQGWRFEKKLGERMVR